MIETSLIVTPPLALPPIQLNAAGIEMRDLALSASALIGQVRNAEQNNLAVDAQRQLKEFRLLIERERKKHKEPALEYGRAVDRFAAAAVVEVEKEETRIARLAAEFQEEERIRVQEEERKQQQELERIEREKQAELQRIADEQARIDRQARDAREEAERLAREATNKKQRADAESAAAAARALQATADQQSTITAAKVEQIETKAAEKTYVESRPIEATKTAAQQIKTDWEIEITNPYELARLHPDCVKIEALMTPIKAALNAGREIKGIMARKITVADVKTRRQKEIQV